ncbi:hypothetical protein N0V90_007921 [Kalmusia sp. IMI 367209]|nr:hypothetical protein N0V90_007921 [Kalmusia sp. IMI 367209]
MSYNIIYPFGDTINEGAQIGRGQGIKSKSGRVVLNVTNSGVIELIGDGKVLWTAQQKAPYADFIIMQGDGNFVAYSIKEPTWASASNGTGHPYCVVVQDDGNLVVKAGDRPVWSSQTGGAIA